MIKVGEKAPNLILEGFHQGKMKKFNVYEYLKTKKWVVLFFYPLDFSFICPTEIASLNQHYEKFPKDVEIFAISVDSIYAHKEWSKQFNGIKFPLLSDINKEAIKEYEVDLPSGIALRGTFIIDPQGTLRYALVHDNNIGRSVIELLRVVEALKTGDLSPSDWKPGQKTLGKG